VVVVVPAPAEPVLPAGTVVVVVDVDVVVGRPDWLVVVDGGVVVVVGGTVVVVVVVVVVVLTGVAPGT
jgi:hypothetical protein